VGSVVDGVRLLASLAADRAGKPPTSSSLADEKRVSSLLLNTAHRWAGARYARAIVEARRRTIRGLTARAQCSQLTAEPSASPAFARTRRNSRARRSASKEEMLAPSSSKAASQAASNLAARWAVTR
jgi:hypothetical protein